MESPILVETLRGPIKESVHRGCIAVVEPDGKLVAYAGDISRVACMRSTAKPIQAIPLIASGTADRFGFTAPELAIIAASHDGESIHTQLVASILEKIGLDKSKLRCGNHLPADWSVHHLPKGSQGDVLQNNCSGKHASMLAMCVAGGFDIATYDFPDHPIQQEILRTVAQLARTTPREVLIGVESCGVPVFGVSIQQIALAYASLANPVGQPATLGTACRRIVDAMLRYPELVGGTCNRICTEIMRALGHAVLVKSGAEAICAMSVLPGKHFRDGLGIAFKIEDGNNRGTAVVAVETLNQLKLLQNWEKDRLATWARSPIKDYRGERVGELKPVFGLTFV